MRFCRIFRFIYWSSGRILFSVHADAQIIVAVFRNICGVAREEIVSHFQIAQLFPADSIGIIDSAGTAENIPGQISVRNHFSDPVIGDISNLVAEMIFRNKVIGEISNISIHADTQLFEIGNAGGGTRFLSGSIQCREQHSRQDRNDGYNDEEFDQCESVAAPHCGMTE